VHEKSPLFHTSKGVRGTGLQVTVDLSSEPGTRLTVNDKR